MHWIDFMNIKKVLPIALIGLLVGCDTEDENNIDSILISPNDYKVVEFTLKPNQEVNISVQDINHVLSESYIIDQTSYQDWQDETQNGDFENALLNFEFAFPPLSGKHQSGWLPLGNGLTADTTFYLFFENTKFGVVAPPEGGDEMASTMMYTLELRN